MKNEVVVGIVKKDNRVLIVKRKQPEGGLLWQFPGGKIEAGETDEQAVIREVKEETGAEVKIMKYLGARIHPSTNKVMSYWACEYVFGEIKIPDQELAQAKWVEIEKLKNYFTTPVYSAVMEYLGLKQD